MDAAWLQDNLVLVIGCGAGLLLVAAAAIGVAFLPPVARRRRRRRELKRFRQQAVVDFDRGYAELAIAAVSPADRAPAGPAQGDAATTGDAHEPVLEDAAGDAMSAAAAEAAAEDHTVDDAVEVGDEGGVAEMTEPEKPSPNGGSPTAFAARQAVEPPPGYVPLPIPELWEPATDTVPVVEPGLAVAQAAATPVFEPVSEPAPVFVAAPVFEEASEPAPAPVFEQAVEPASEQVFEPAPAPAADEVPPGYVPLEMPELWEPPTEESQEQEPAPAAEAAAAKAERAARDASMSQPGSGVPVAAEGEWADPDAVQIRVLPSSATTGPVARQTLPAVPSAVPPAVPSGVPSTVPLTSVEPVAPQYPHPPVAQVQVHPAAQVQPYPAAAQAYPAVQVQTHPPAQVQAYPAPQPQYAPAQQPQYAPAQQHPQAPAQQFPGARPATGAIPRPRRIPRSMQELRSGPFEGREFETPQELAVAAVLELGYPAPAIARLFRVPSYRVEEWIRTAQAPRPRVPRQGTAGRPLDR
ncbi:hypothetical protein [Microbacterium sp. GXF7504]